MHPPVTSCLTGKWKRVSFNQVKCLVRLRVLLGLLIGLRWRDLESAVRFMNVRYPHDPRVVRLFKFINWCRNVIWRQIPDSESWVELPESISPTPYWLTAQNPIRDHPWVSNPGLHCLSGQSIVFRILGKRPDPDYHPNHFFSPFRFTDPARYGIQSGRKSGLAGLESALQKPG